MVIYIAVKADCFSGNHSRWAGVRVIHRDAIQIGKRDSGSKLFESKSGLILPNKNYDISHTRETLFKRCLETSI
jgi:hypothetical protein